MPSSSTLQATHPQACKCQVPVADQACAHAQWPVLMGVTWPFTLLLLCTGSAPQRRPFQQEQAGQPVALSRHTASAPFEPPVLLSGGFKHSGHCMGLCLPDSLRLQVAFEGVGWLDGPLGLAMDLYWKATFHRMGLATRLHKIDRY